MVFSSLSFIYFFLPCVILFYFVARNRTWRNSVLLIFSLLFYSWGEPKYIILMLAASLLAYIGGILISHCEQRRQYSRKKAAFISTVILITANLFVFKYLGFATESVNRIFNTGLPVPQILLPIGISFFTFQILSYVIDLYRGEVELQRNFFLLLLYVCFFPQLIAGPIVRYQTIEDEIQNRHETLNDVSAGIKRFIIGLAKKVIIANQTGSIAETIFSADSAAFGSGVYWLAAVAYTLQIYFDFSGYSDMAIGLGRVFGFHFLENFNYPYISRSVTEFWRRWHISLSSWFRDYIYIPLGGNRVRRSRWIINIFVVWSLTGLWHGAQWNFVLWGLYYAVLLVLEKFWLRRILGKLPGFAAWCYTMLMVVIGWVLFNVTNMTQLSDTLRIMFSFTATDWTQVLMEHTRLLNSLLIIPLGILCMLPVYSKLKLEKESFLSAAASYLVHGALLIICIVILVSSTYNPFIYFRF